MPIIAVFDGIIIRMFFNDHPPPHFHVQYGGERAIMTVAEARLLAGNLPPAILRRVSVWARDNQAALFETWQRARNGDPLGEI